MGLMPTYMEQEGILSTKMVCFYNREDGSTLPSTNATVLLFDPEYGNVKAVSRHMAALPKEQLPSSVHQQRSNKRKREFQDRLNRPFEGFNNITFKYIIMEGPDSSLIGESRHR